MTDLKLFRSAEGAAYEAAASAMALEQSLPVLAERNRQAVFGGPGENAA